MWRHQGGWEPYKIRFLYADKPVEKASKMFWWSVNILYINSAGGKIIMKRREKKGGKKCGKFLSIYLVCCARIIRDDWMSVEFYILSRGRTSFFGGRPAFPLGTGTQESCPRTRNANVTGRGELAHGVPVFNSDQSQASMRNSNQSQASMRNSNQLQPFVGNMKELWRKYDEILRKYKETWNYEGIWRK